MLKLVRSSRVLQGIALFVLGAATVLILWPNALQSVFGGNAAPHIHDASHSHASGSHETAFAHGHCYLWDPRLLWLHVISDASIGLSYVAISTTLAYLVYKARRDIPFHWMFLAFGVFIIACGGTHFMEVLTVWVPAYWSAGGLKMITAAASVATALVLPPVVPQAIALMRTARLSEERKEQLENAHAELEVLYAKRQELDQLKSQFFANVSHELRTPLTLILGPTQNLLDSTGLDEKQRHDLETIERNARTLLKHVNDLLDASKLEAGKMGIHYNQLDLANLVRLTAANFESLAQERRIEFAVETPPTLPAQADGEKLQRALVNLLSNAFKFTPDGGTVRCTLSQADSKEATMAHRATLEVRDSGPGVAAEMREAVFERFRQADSSTTRRVGGTGLGLAIVREFIELHGGHVTASEAPEGGAAFTLELPLTAPPGTVLHSDEINSVPSGEAVVQQALSQLQPAKEVIINQQQEEADSSSPLVLVVEDNLEMNRFIAGTLSSQYRVASAVDGHEGIQKALELQPDLIVCDLMMPRLSGDQLLREVRANPQIKDIPIILLTAKADEAMRVQLLREGAQDYLMKPFPVEELKARVANQVALKRVRDVLQQELEVQHQELEVQHQDLETMAQEVALRRRDAEAAYAALHQSERMYRELADAMPQIVWSARPDGYLDYYNRRWFEYTGFTEEQSFSEEGWKPVLHPADVEPCHERWYQAVRTGEAYEIEYRFKRAADGTYRWHLGRALPMRNEENQIIRWFGTCTDIDDQKRIMEERSQLLEREHTARQAAEEASRTKDEFLATLSHELRTPLTAMMGWIGLLRGGTLDEATTEEALETIERNTKVQAQLVEDILDVSRVITGKIHLKMHPFAPAPVVEAAITAARPAAAARNIQLEYEVQGPVARISGEERRLQQIMWNLISNAIKFTSHDGHVGVRLVQKEQTVEIQVSDNGQGIRPDFLPYVFDRFRQADSSSTRAHGGLGLGLAIARHLVELHGGTIEASSPGPGRGATFTVRLPALTD